MLRPKCFTSFDRRIFFSATAILFSLLAYLPQAHAADGIIAFERAGRIYTINPDGTNLRSQMLGGDPRFSKDGEMFTYRDGAEIWVADVTPSGGFTNKRMVYNSGAMPALSPDKSKVAFISSHLYVIGIDGTGLTQLTDLPSRVRSPDWSPDGSTIIFASEGFEDPPFGSQWDVYSVSASGGGLSRLTNHEQRSPVVSDPRYSPDGSRIYYRFHNFSSEFDGISSVSANGALIVDRPANGLAWSPDGTKIAFSARDTLSPLIVASASGGSPQIIYDFKQSPLIQDVTWGPSLDDLQLTLRADPEEIDTDSGTLLQLFVKNNGSTDISNITVSELTLDPDDVLELFEGPTPNEIEVLAPGEERVIEYEFFSSKVGQTQITAKVAGTTDSGAIESSQKTTPITVVPGQGLTLLRIAPSVIEVGGKAIVKFEFQNTTDATIDSATPPAALEFQSILGGQLRQVAGPQPATATDIAPEDIVSFYYLVEGIAEGESKPLGKIAYQIGGEDFETPDASPSEPLEIGPIVDARFSSATSISKEREEFTLEVELRREDSFLDRVEDSPFADPRPIFENLRVNPSFTVGEGLMVEATNVSIEKNFDGVFFDGDPADAPALSFGPEDRLTFTFTLKGELEEGIEEAVELLISASASFSLDGSPRSEEARCDFGGDGGSAGNCNGSNLSIDITPDACVVSIEDLSPPLIFHEGFVTLVSASGEPIAVCGSGSGQCSVVSEEVKEQINLRQQTESARGTTKNVGQEVILKAEIELPSDFTMEDISSITWDLGGHTLDYYTDFSDYRRMSLAEGKTAFLFDPGPNGTDRSITKEPPEEGWDRVAYLWKDDGQFDVKVTVTATKDDSKVTCDTEESYTVERNMDDYKKSAEKLYSSCCDEAVAPGSEGSRQRVAFMHEQLHNQDDAQVVFPGDSWITFHRVIVESYNRWRDFFGYPRIGQYDGSVPIPASENGFTLAEPTRLSNAPRCNFPWDPSDALCPLSPWFTVGGRVDGQGNQITRIAQDLNNPAACKFANGAIVPLGQTKLNDFQDNISLGCVLSKSWHNEMHQTISGVMLGTLQSVYGPSFWRMHNFLTGAEIGGAPGPLTALPVRSRFFGPSTAFAQSAEEELSVFAAWEREQAKGPPGVSLYLPRKNFPVPTIQLVIIQFWEEVTGVVPELVQVDGSPATAVTRDGPFYIFSGFETPDFGDATVEVLPGDVVDNEGNAFAGFSWIVPIEQDSDGDGISDSIDNCPDVPNPTQINSDRITRFVPGGDGPNATRFQSEGDLLGDACDDDDDNDGISDVEELLQGSDPLDPNSPDGCPNNPNKTEPGLCGCEVLDLDTDGDNFVDCGDVCPFDPEKTFSAGICGCGVPETDTDGDSVPDCLDQCPSDPLKTSPGICGCGVPEGDFDGDGESECGFQNGGFCQAGEECLFGELPQVACTYVNSFLDHINIATVINKGNEELRAKISYREGFAGEVKSTVIAEVGPSLRQDIIINGLALEPNSVGTVCVEVPEGSSWSGGTTIYKPKAGGSLFGEAFDYALYYPFTAPVIGTSIVPLNTYHLGVSRDDTVANWVSIADGIPGDGKGVKGTLYFDSPNGEVLSSINVKIGDGGRTDYSGHDAIAGPTNIDAIGTARFVSEDGASPYTMNSARYFYNCGGGAGCSNFYTAFALPNRPATDIETVGMLSPLTDSVSVAEVFNGADTQANSSLTLYSESGLNSDQQVFAIPTKGSRHFILATREGEPGGDSTAAALIRAGEDPLSAIGVYYKLDENGVLQHAHASPFKGGNSVKQVSEFNTFIEQDNLPALANLSEASISVNVKAFSFDGALLLNQDLVLGPKESTILDVSTFPEDIYGTFVAISDEPGMVFTNDVRRKDEYVLPFLGR